MIYGAPEVMRLSIDPAEHLVQVPAPLRKRKLDLARADLTRALELKPDYEMAISALAEIDKAEAKGLPR